MYAKFKSITATKDGLHKLRYSIEEKKGEATITSSVTIIIEDNDELLMSESLEKIIEKGSEIALKEYRRK